MKGIWKYGYLLPSIEEEYRLTLGEGNTPLVKSRRLSKMLGLENLYFKLEMTNPSGSYKDRFAACAISDLLQKKVNVCFATSSGNTGAALSAYCSAAGIRCLLAIVDGAPKGKVQQMQIYGAETIMIKDFGKDAAVTEQVFSLLKAVADELHTSIQISAYKFCPAGMEGVQTIAYEIAEELNMANAHIFSPAGGGGLTLAMARGFRRWEAHHNGYSLPRLHCVQPIGNNTISGPLREGLTRAAVVERSDTLISGLQVPNIIDGDEVIASCRALNGNGYTVSDELVFKCHADMALKEGIFCEPAGAVALAGLITALENGEIDKKDHFVCLVTGHGFKDPASAENNILKCRDQNSMDAEEAILHIQTQARQGNSFI